MGQGVPSLPIQGRRARVELAADAFEVWKLGQPQAPLARFDRTQLGWEAAAWREFYRLEHSGWRSVKVGWVFLHGVVIGAFGMSMLQGLLIAAFGGGSDDVTLDTANGFQLYVRGTTAVVTAAAGATGWLLFVYLRASTAARWAALLVSLLVGVTIGLTIA